MENTVQQEDGKNEEILNSTDILDNIPRNIKVQQPVNNTGNQFILIQKTCNSISIFFLQ